MTDFHILMILVGVALVMWGYLELAERVRG
jgi:hypothetical protein